MKRLAALLFAIAIAAPALLAIPGVASANSGVPGPCLNDPNGGSYDSNWNISEWTPGSYPFVDMELMATWHARSTCTGELPGSLDRVEASYTFATLQYAFSPQLNAGRIVQVGFGNVVNEDAFGHFTNRNVFMYTPNDDDNGELTAIPDYVPVEGSTYSFYIQNTGAHWCLAIYLDSPRTLLWSTCITNSWGNSSFMWVGEENENLYSMLGPSNPSVLYTYATNTKNPTTYNPYNVGAIYTSPGQPAWQYTIDANWPAFYTLTP